MTMTDAHMLSHTFPLSHQLSLSAAWSQLNDSATDEAIPSLVTPFPSLNHLPSTEMTTTFDPALCVTPERSVSSRVPLQQPVQGVSESHCEPHQRTTKVHFDHTVSVHHLSPESISNGASPDDHCLYELNTDVLSSMCTELDISDVEPVSIIASDLRRLSPNSQSLVSQLESSRSLQRNCSAGKSKSGDNARPKKPKLRSRPLVTEVGSTTTAVPADSINSCLSDAEPTEESDCVLARPEFNSTLKMSSEIAQLQQQEFDLVAVTKEKINPKLKQQVFEKVLLMSAFNLIYSLCTLLFGFCLSAGASHSKFLQMAEEFVTAVHIYYEKVHFIIISVDFVLFEILFFISVFLCNYNNVGIYQFTVA